MRVICQNGVEAELVKFGLGGVLNTHIIGTKENGNKYVIGEYNECFTALTELSKIIQHTGNEPYKMSQK